jgi:hypothetical protein
LAGSEKTVGRRQGQEQAAGDRKNQSIFQLSFIILCFPFLILVVTQLTQMFLSWPSSMDCFELVRKLNEKWKMENDNWKMLFVFLPPAPASAPKKGPLARAFVLG